MGGWVGGVGSRLLILSPKMLKSQILMSRVGKWVGGMVGGVWQSTFDAESKNAKIPNSHVWWGGGWGWQKPISKSQLQIS